MLLTVDSQGSDTCSAYLQLLSATRSTNVNGVERTQAPSINESSHPYPPAFLFIRVHNLAATTRVARRKNVIEYGMYHVLLTGFLKLGAGHLATALNGILKAVKVVSIPFPPWIVAMS